MNRPHNIKLTFANLYTQLLTRAGTGYGDEVMVERGGIIAVLPVGELTFREASVLLRGGGH